MATVQENIIPIKVTVGTTPVQLPHIACRSVVLKADKSNTGIVYAGKADISLSRGFPLEAGESNSFGIDFANKIWLLADTDDQIVWAEMSTGAVSPSYTSNPTITGTENVNLQKIGGTTQSGADVVDTSNSAFKVNVVTGSVTSNPEKYTGPQTVQASVTTTAAQLPSLSGNLIMIKNDDASTVPVYIGGSTVTSSNGFKLSPTAGIVIECTNSNTFYAITDTGTATIDVLVMS